MERTRVSSTNIASIGYDLAKSTLEVEFRDGAIYQYYGVSAAIHHDFMGAPSKGSFLDQHIKSKFRYRRV